MFGTSGIRGTVGTDVTSELAVAVGRALASEGADRVVVGRDHRESGPALLDALTAGLRECGADAVDVGLASTPTIARSVEWFGAEAGVSVTASHNPPGANGFKLWDADGAAFGPARREAVAARIETADYDLQPAERFGSVEVARDAVERHVAALVEAGRSLEGLTVAVDPGNGCGRLTAEALHRLGCTIETLNAEPDGRFPNRPSEPTATNCRSLCFYVGSSDADLGIAHDGDADRMMAVTDTGTFVPGDQLLALFARDAAGPGDRVAAPVDTSTAVADHLAAVGASVERTPVGDTHVAAKAAEPGFVFGGEPSGTWIWPAETRCPDGPLAAVKLAALVAEHGPLSAQLADVPTYPVRRESVEVADNAAAMETVSRLARRRYGEVGDIDGVRVETDDGWFLLRASGTEPLVRITAEGRTETRAAAVFEEARALLEAALDAEGAGVPEAAASAEADADRPSR